MSVRLPGVMVAAVSLVAVVAASETTNDAAIREPHATLHTREAFVMGTRLMLATYADTRSRGLEHLERMLEVIERTEDELSTWRPASEISRLNAAAGGEPQPLTKAACRLLTDVGRESLETGGAFDPAIGALVAAWGLHGAGRVPTRDEIATARSRSGWWRVSLDEQRCTLRLPAGASIDVGAFGKGEALDRVRAEMRDADPWLVDLGGQVAVSSLPPRERAWTVMVAHPRIRSESVVLLRMTRGSVSTTAGSERDVHVDGKRVGHVLDPRTGAPAPFDGSVSVWSERALTADILSTALYVMGPDEGLRWADARGVAALFLEVGSDEVLRRRPSRAWTGSGLDSRVIGHEPSSSPGRRCAERPSSRVRERAPPPR